MVRQARIPQQATGRALRRVVNPLAHIVHNHRWRCRPSSFRPSQEAWHNCFPLGFTSTCEIQVGSLLRRLFFTV